MAGGDFAGQQLTTTFQCTMRNEKTANSLSMGLERTATPYYHKLAINYISKKLYRTGVNLLGDNAMYGRRRSTRCQSNKYW